MEPLHARLDKTRRWVICAGDNCGARIAEVHEHTLSSEILASEGKHYAVYFVAFGEGWMEDGDTWAMGHAARQRFLRAKRPTVPRQSPLTHRSAFPVMSDTRMTARCPVCNRLLLIDMKHLGVPGGIHRLIDS